MNTTTITTNTTTKTATTDHAQNTAAADTLFGLSMPMAQAFGMQGEVFADDKAVIRMPFLPAYANSRGDMHGGVFATLLDCVLASACRTHEPERFGVLTVDLTVHYVASAHTEVVASAECLRRGRSLCFAQGHVHDAQGRLLAMATGTFKLVERQSQA